MVNHESVNPLAFRYVVRPFSLPLTPSLPLTTVFQRDMVGHYFSNILHDTT